VPFSLLPHGKCFSSLFFSRTAAFRDSPFFLSGRPFFPFLVRQPSLCRRAIVPMPSTCTSMIGALKLLSFIFRVQFFQAIGVLDGREPQRRVFRRRLIPPGASLSISSAPLSACRRRSYDMSGYWFFLFLVFLVAKSWMVSLVLHFLVPFLPCCSWDRPVAVARLLPSSPTLVF